MRQFLKFCRPLQQLKNLIIFLPLITSSKLFDLNNITDLIISLFSMIIITSVCYITNDFKDREADKLNLLKKRKNLPRFINLKFIIILNLSLIFLILVSQFFFEYILFTFYYLGTFYIYIFFAKKVQYVDILFLIFFYIFRIYYGAHIADIEITKIFISFFITLFLTLSIYKRLIQIRKNRLKEKNSIISYSINDIQKLKNFLIISIISNNFIFVSYLYNDKNILNISPDENFEFLIILILNIFTHTRIYRLFINNKINEEFYNFILKDKLITFSVLICIVILIIKKIFI